MPHPVDGQYQKGLAIADAPMQPPMFEKDGACHVRLRGLQSWPWSEADLRSAKQGGHHSILSKISTSGPLRESVLCRNQRATVGTYLMVERLLTAPNFLFQNSTTQAQRYFDS